MQSTKNILLVNPANFVFNKETEISNAFQTTINESEDVLKRKVFTEFEEFAKTLQVKGINVFVFDDTAFPQKPDAIFPNNWVSFHADGTVILYPMYATNRQAERKTDIIDTLRQHFKIINIIDLSVYENEGRYLEGTGSIIFDHDNKITYACISPRTDEGLFLDVCKLLQYTPIAFHAYDKNGKEIYHTNV